MYGIDFLGTLMGGWSPLFFDVEPSIRANFGLQVSKRAIFGPNGSKSHFLANFGRSRGSGRNFEPGSVSTNEMSLMDHRNRKINIWGVWNGFWDF